MNDGTILHIDFIAHADAVYISAQYCIEPHTAIVTHNYIAHDSGIWSKVAVTSNGRKNAFDRKDQRHD